MPCFLLMENLRHDGVKRLELIKIVSTRDNDINVVGIFFRTSQNGWVIISSVFGLNHWNVSFFVCFFLAHVQHGIYIITSFFRTSQNG